MRGNPTLFHWTKSIEKNIDKRQNIDAINRKRFFDRSADHK